MLGRNPPKTRVPEGRRAPSPLPDQEPQIFPSPGGTTQTLAQHVVLGNNPLNTRVPEGRRTPPPLADQEPQIFLSPVGTTQTLAQHVVLGNNPLNTRVPEGRRTPPPLSTLQPTTLQYICAGHHAINRNHRRRYRRKAPRSRPRSRRLGLRRDRRRHHDRHRHFSQARRNGPRRPLRFRSVRRMDCRRDPLALWRALLRRARRNDSRSRRRVCLPAPRLRSRLGISFRLDALYCRPSLIDVFHRRRLGALPRVSLARRCHADLHVTHRAPRTHRLAQALRLRFHLGATAGRALAGHHDRRELSRCATRRSSPGLSHRHQNHFRGHRDWRRLFCALILATHHGSHLAGLVGRRRIQRVSRRASRGAVGL